MLNNRKIHWMARASIYEKRAGRRDLKRNEYFFSDYIRMNALKHFVGVTVAYILILGIYAVYRMDTILNMATNLKLGLLLREALLIYIVLLLVYTGISVILYAWQYQSSRGRVKKYYRMLKLIEKYEQEDE